MKKSKIIILLLLVIIVVAVGIVMMKNTNVSNISQIEEKTGEQLEVNEINDNVINPSQEDIVSAETEKGYREGEALILVKNDKAMPLFASKSINPTDNSIWNDLTICDEFNLKDTQNNNAEANAMKSNDSSLRYLHVKSEKYTTQQIIDSLKNEVYHIQPNYIYKATSVTNDPYQKAQWAIENTGQFDGKEGYDINPIASNDDEQKVIVVLDSGVNYNHEDLKDAMWKDSNGKYGYDIINNDDDPMDDCGHGTMCAGTIAASSNNSKGITGALIDNKNIKIMSVKVLDDTGLRRYEYNC